MRHDLVKRFSWILCDTLEQFPQTADSKKGMGIRVSWFHFNCPLKVLTSLHESWVFVVGVLAFVEEA
jgi:hypothetical protein